MNHFYQNIQGWFTFPTFYSEIVKKAENKHHFVEVGTWKGTSAAYMAVEIINSKKEIKFDCVDTWQGDSSISSVYDEPLLNTPGALYEHFLKNIEPVKDYINPIRMTSVEAAKQYKDKSLNFVFIDGAHDYESVKNDLIAWLPKVEKNGILSGHDYAHIPVQQALKDVLNSGYFYFGENVWVYNVNK